MTASGSRTVKASADGHLGGILGDHVLEQVGDKRLVVVLQPAIEEDVMRQVRAGQPAQPAVSRVQAPVQREVDRVEDERRGHEERPGLEQQTR